MPKVSRRKFIAAAGAAVAANHAPHVSGLTSHARIERGEFLTNSIGMRLVRIHPGTFTMEVSGEAIPEAVALAPWRAGGDFDERPTHRVHISKEFYMGAFEVTNAEYEQFDPGHCSLRGRDGISKENQEAVVFVSWNEANHFCQWLSKREGQPYRLPTEAEWEFAARAGTTTHFSTGDTLPDAFQKNGSNDIWPPIVYPPANPVSIVVGQTPPNPWGLYDMHGNVEERVHDWYGPYEPDEQIDPVGPVIGEFRVTRGGSHSTQAYFLRSENRMGTLPDDRHGLIGFRVVLGPTPKTKPLPATQPPLNQRNVSQLIPGDLAQRPDPAKPYFRLRAKYVKIQPNSYGPMFSTETHDTAIVEAPSGDLLAIFYSCVNETDRELNVLATRLRYGQEEWDDTSPFWDAPDRNDHAPALWFDGEKVWDSPRKTVATRPGSKDMVITDASGTQRPVSGLFAALSFDEGEACPMRRLVSDDGPDRLLETTMRRTSILGKSSAENFGYLSACQGKNGIIHPISDINHYSFNLAWLKTPPPALS